MTYSKDDFTEIREWLQKILINENGEPLSCDLYNCEFHSDGSIYSENEDGEEAVFHIAEACNIAEKISSIDRLLKIPRSNVACSDLSEILLTQLDILREYIFATVSKYPNATYKETEADKLIRRWAGFLKHPKEFVFAHRCFTELGSDLDEEVVEINSRFLADWDGLSNKQKDQNKKELAQRVVSVCLPELEDIRLFIISSANHIKVICSLK